MLESACIREAKNLQHVADDLILIYLSFNLNVISTISLNLARWPYVPRGGCP